MNNIDAFDNADGEAMQMWSKVASQLTGVPSPQGFEEAVLLKTALGSLPSVGASVTASVESLSFESGVFQKLAFSNLSRVSVPENFEADVLLKIRQTPQPATTAFPFKNIAYFLLPLLFVGTFFFLNPSDKAVEPVKTGHVEKNVVTPVNFPPVDSVITKADTAKTEPKKAVAKKRKVKKDTWKPTRGFPIK
ncbi:MAG: hypothetical protein V4642_10900 [Bacteroidota bacterium]